MSLVMPTRILVVGGGGREHALAWKLAGEPGVNEVIVAPGSAGIAAEPRVSLACRACDPLDRRRSSRSPGARRAELVVIGPEAPLAAGVADALIEAGVRRLRRRPRRPPGSSRVKAFCHEVAAAAGVRMARGRGVHDAGRGGSRGRDRAGGGRVAAS